MQNIFNNNKSPLPNSNIFQNRPQPSTNLFTSNQSQNQNNQNQSNQLLNISSQQSQSPSKPIPPHPVVDDTLQQQNSFIQIKHKIQSRIKLTEDEHHFVTIKGLSLFEKDEWKSNYFNTIKVKQPHFGFTSNQLMYTCQVPQCKDIVDIWTKIIKHFAYVCNTNEMNGYFILKRILKESKIYKQFYRPNPGLSNKVLQANKDFITTFFQKTLQGKHKVNKDGVIYQQYLQRIIIAYIQEWKAFLDIIEIVSMGKLENEEQSVQQLNRQQISINSSLNNQLPMKTRTYTIKFQDLQRQNIINQLWKVYKQLALSNFNKAEYIVVKQEDKVKQTVFLMKKNIFLRVSQLIGRILAQRYNQQMLMEKPPLPLFEVIKFISNDIEVIQQNNLIEPNIQDSYVQNSLNIILFAIPFASFITEYNLIENYFTLPSQKAKFATAISPQQRTKILQELVQVNFPLFMPLKIWARLQLSRINRDKKNRNRIMRQSNEIDPNDALKIWQEYVQKNINHLSIFHQKKWKYLIGLWMENLTPQNIIKSPLLKSLMIFYCKNTLKKRADQFFMLWDDLNLFQQSEQSGISHIQRRSRQLSQNPSRQQMAKDYLYRLPKKILGSFDLFVVGRFIKILLENCQNEAYKLLTALLAYKNNFDDNYTQKLFDFLEDKNVEDRDNIRQNANTLLRSVILSLSRGFRIKCYCYDQQKEVAIEYNAIEVNLYFEQFMSDNEQEVKFFCQLVKDNVRSLLLIESIVFDTINQLDVNNISGLRTCIFLCKMLQRCNLFYLSSIKSLRYIISAIDCLFNCQATRQKMLFALSIVFPYQRKSLSDKSLTRVNRTFLTNSNQSVNSSISPIGNIINLLQNQSQLGGQQQRQIKKLRNVISYHLNNMLKYSDSLDEYFTIQKKQNEELKYTKIQTQINDWKFNQAKQFLSTPNKKTRRTDWFYTIARILQFNTLIPIDIHSIILCLRKMRITNQDSPAYLPMLQLMANMKNGSILQQLIYALKPTILKQNYSLLIKNEMLTSYDPIEIKVKQFSQNSYSKYQNKHIVLRKSISLAQHQQQNLIRKIFMFARLIQQILKLKLQQDFQQYNLILQLNFVTELLQKLTNKQTLHKYQINYFQKKQQTTSTINLPSAIISLLNIYTYQLLLPLSVKQIRSPVYLLPCLQKKSYLQITYQPKYITKTFSLQIQHLNQRLYQYYGKQFKYLSQRFFDNILFQFTDYTFENDQTSLRSTILNITQLLIQNGHSKLLTQCIDNYAFPISNEQALMTYNPIKKYLDHDKSRSMIPLLFDHIKSILPGQNLIYLTYAPQLLILKVRAIQSLCILLKVPIFYQQIIKLLSTLRKQFIKLITQQQIYSQKCPRPQQINILNKISLFILNLLQKRSQRYRLQLNENILINNFLIYPQNILRLLFHRMNKLLPNNNQIDKMIFIQSSQTLTNYLMQTCLVRITLFRITYNILIRILFIVFEYLKKDVLNDLLHYLFLHYQLITSKPIDFITEPKILYTLNMIPSQTIFIKNQPNQNIKTIILPQQVTDFSYTYRTNLRKYGPNFLYNYHLAFHRIKIKLQNNQIPNINQYYSNKQYIREQIYLIQLVNCLKSFNFSYQSLVKTYYQFMNIITNTGPIGQNLSIYSLDKSLLSNYEYEICINKYLLNNKYSFLQSLHSLNHFMNQQSLITKLTKTMQNMLIYMRKQKYNYNIFFNQNQQINIDQKNIPINSLSIVKYIKTKSVQCINSDHILKFILNIMKTINQSYSLIGDLKKHTLDCFKFLQKFLQHLTKQQFNCTFRVFIHSIEGILTQYNYLLQIQASPRLLIEGQVLKHKKQKYLQIKLKALQSFRSILFKCYQKQKPTLYLRGSEYFLEQVNKNKQKIDEIYSKQQVEENISLICSICNQILNELPENISITKSSQVSLQDNKYKQFNSQILKHINYILKLLTQNISSIQNSIALVSIFSLCNKFYLLNSYQIIQKWPFYYHQQQKCHQIFLKQLQQDGLQNSFYLQRISILDTYSIYTIVNQTIFYKQLLKIIINSINIDQNFFIQQKSLQSKKYVQSKKSVQSKKLIQTKKQSSKSYLTNQSKLINNLSPSFNTKKRYNFRSHQKSYFQTVHLDKLIEYKKLLTSILQISIPQIWNNLNFSPQMNSIFLQILYFDAIDFNIDKLGPCRPVQQRLKKLIVFQQLPASYKQKIRNNKQYQIDALSYESRHSYSYNGLNRLSQYNNPLNSNNEGNITPSKYKFSTSLTTTKISLFEFIGFVHHNQLIFNYLLILKTGFIHSQIMVQIGGYILQTNQYNQIWSNIFRILSILYDYFADYTQIFLQNQSLITNLTTLYNYVAQQPSYLNQFQGLTLFFDRIQPQYINTQLIKQIIQYSITSIQIVSKWRDMEWKGQLSWSKQRLIILNKCLQLIQKIKVINAFKELNLFIDKHSQIKKKINDQIIKQKQSIKQGQDYLNSSRRY